MLPNQSANESQLYMVKTVLENRMDQRQQEGEVEDYKTITHNNIRHITNFKK